MTEKIYLTQWSVHEAPMSEGGPAHAGIAPGCLKENESGIPGLVHEYLLAEGKISEPLEAENCFDCEWVEKRGWRFVTEFEVTKEFLAADAVELVFEAIDGKAAIFLNGQPIGEQKSAFYPFTRSVNQLLVEGRNRLEAFLTSGLEDFTEQDALSPDNVAFATEESLGYRERRGDLRRIFLRRPAYIYGWDWSPRLVILGIPGRVYLKALRGAEVRRLEAHLHESAGSQALLNVSVEVGGPHCYRSVYAMLECVLFGPEGEVAARCSRKFLLRSGMNVQHFTMMVNEPQFWWPRGYGDQPLYRLRVEVRNLEHTLLDASEASIGLRTITLLDVDTFTLEVNGRRIFCQGGNWVPPDAIYTRPSDDDYERLLQAAADGGMNMLRIWGGGNYERDIFYQTCDRLGLLVWHDFMFACSPYPDQFEWFRQEIGKEARYQVRRLANRPCMALWCGSNENSWAFQEWWKDRTERGAWLYNELLPEVVRLHAPLTPYWTGSPYGGRLPNETGIGNNHLWKSPGGYLATDIDDRLDLTGHDRYRSLFISEYGVHGPCGLRTTLQYLGGSETSRASPNWRHHTNTRRYEETLTAVLKRIYGLNACSLPLEDYLHFGGIWQGIAAAYAFEAARLRPECSGSLIWMFNECWGEAGWGLVDYYQRKKPAWYYVRRALLPQRLILRREEEELLVSIVCQRPCGESMAISVGYSLLDGRSITLGQAKQALVSERTLMGRFAIPADLPPGGLFYARCDGEQALDIATLWPGSLAELAIPEGRPSISILERCDDRCELLVESATFLHGVSLDVDDGIRVSDNYFDLLPGESRVITVTGDSSSIEKMQIGWVHSSLMHEKALLHSLVSPGDETAVANPKSESAICRTLG